MFKKLHKMWHWMPLNLRFIFAANAISSSTVALFAALYAYYQIYFLTYSFLVLFPLFILVFYLVIVKRELLYSSWILLATIAAYTGLAIGKIGGTSGPVLYWLALPALCGGLILQKKGILGGALFGLLALVSIRILEITSDLTTHQINLGAGYHLIAFVFFLGLITTASLEYVRTNRAVYGEEARKLNSLLSIVTHDLSSPLTLLLFGAKKLTIDETLTPAQRADVQKLYQASSMMKVLIDKVRKIKALQAGKLQSREEDSSATLEGSFAALGALFEGKLLRKEQTLAIELPEGIAQLRLAVDPTLFLHDVLGNLLSNAIKFSPLKAVIRLKASRLHNTIEVMLSDEGVGIPDDILPFIFNDDVSTQRRGTEGEKGTGFGLPLVQYIVMSWGGKIEVVTATESSNRGTSFRFTLPLANPNDSAPSKSAA